jgi:type IV pilus assembly protein PilB
MQAAKKRLGEMLIESGVIDPHQLQSALGHQRKWGGKLGQALVDLKLATEPQIVNALSRKFGYEVVDVGALPRTAPVEAALRLVPKELALRQTLIPIAADTGSITVAMSDPSNIAVVDEIAFRTGRRVKVALAGDRQIAGAVRRLYFAEEEPGTRAIALDVPPPLPARPVALAPPLAEPDPLGEPILATNLAPDEEEGPFEGPIQFRAIPSGGSLGDALERASRGEDLGLRPAKLLAALVKVLIRRGLVTPAELVDELERGKP